MAFISEQELNTIKANIDIVDLINKYVPLTQKGKNFFGVCPFHDDHSPSMSVSKDKQIYKCFSCGASGNVFTFLENYESISFQEAVIKAAEMSGVTLSGEFKKPVSKFTKEYEIMNLSLMYYTNLLNTSLGTEAIKYLENRGFNKEVIKEFDIGLSPDNANGLLDLINNKNLDINTAVNLGLIAKDEKHYYDLYTKRIMFPIHDPMGNLIGYTGRIYKSESQNRYMNSKESVLFKKGNILFNYHRAKDAAKRSHEIIIVEGNLDAIRLASVGIKNVIALMGTALTNNQIELIKKLKSKVILMLDNDDAGELATYNVGAMLFEENIELGIVRLSEVKDPDEYILKKGVDALINNIRNNISYVDFKMHYLKKNMNLNQTEDLRKYIHKILEGMKNTNDEILIELTLNKLSDEYHIDIELLKKELFELRKENNEPPKEILTEVVRNNSKYDNLIINILYYMMNDYKYVKSFKNKLGFIKTKVYRDISNDIIYYADKFKTINVSDFLTYVKLNDYNVSEVDNILKTCTYLEFDDNFFDNCINLVNKEAVNEEIKSLKIKMKNTLDENEKLEILKRITDLKRGSV